MTRPDEDEDDDDCVNHTLFPPLCGRHEAQEVERGWLVTGRLLVRFPGSFWPECRGVPEQGTSP